MKINKKAGRIVQMVSISWPSMMNLLNFFPTTKVNTKYKVMIVISTRIIMAWSWKNKICSMIGEEVSWKEMAIHVGIILVR